MLYHIIAFLCGFILDLLVGDPYWLPHPIRWIGSLIGALEKKFLQDENQTADAKRRKGIITVVLVITITELFVIGLLLGAYYINIVFGVMVETIMTYQLLATKCLRKESMKVYRELHRIKSGQGTIEDARYAVSMIVGRDTQNLDQIQIAKAAVETVAENTSDGVIAPMIFLAFGGPIAGFFYKSINTMDSMIGYKNDRFMDFGRCAAKLDDVVNFLPSRISAWFMIISCFFLGKKYSAVEAYRIFKRDRFNHKSPNSAQTESACAGALGIQLAGDASYFGKIVKKPFIGDKLREIEIDDIKRANNLLYATAIMGEVLFVAILFILGVIN